MVNSTTVKGATKEAAGKVKAAAGKATDNPKLEGKGRADEAEGKIQKTAGKAKTAVKSALK